MRGRPFRTLAPLLTLSGVLLVSCGDSDPLLFPSTAQVRVSGPQGDLEGPAGLPLEPPPEIRAVDSRGNPTPGVEVRFSVEEGGGSVSPETTLTDERGLASPDEWVLGETVGRNVLVVEVEGVGETEFVAQGVPGPAARLEKVAGDRQDGDDGETLSEPLVVQVLDEFGNPVPGETVTFEPASGDGSASPPEAVTDASGIATTTWTLGSGDRTQRLTATAETGVSVTFTANGAFFIELVFVEEPEPAHRAAFEEAAARWESVMTDGLTPVPMELEPGDCGSNSPARTQVVEDVLIFVTLEPLDPGVLGRAGPCWIRIDGALPIVGLVQLNTTLLPTMEAQGTLETVILHEIGHVLGFGTLWSHPTHDFLRDPALPNNRNADPHFDGPLAISAFDAVGGIGYQGAKVPVENDFDRFQSPQGSLDSHWRMSVFGHELMVGQLDPNAPAHPMSAVTLASLVDMGYEVDMNEADPFLIAPGMRLPPARTLIDFGDDIYRGPIGVVDAEGRKVRELRPAPHP